MTIGTALLATGMLVVALLIVCLNDKTKPAPVGKKQASATPGSPFTLLLAILVAGAVIGISIAARCIPGLGAIVALVVLGLILLFVAISLRKLIWALLKMLLSGQLPRVIIPNADGKWGFKCPNCSERITVSPPSEVSDPPFECPHCGERGVWSSITNKS